MGQKRGQRNAAREKVWPGAQGAESRERKRHAGIDVETIIENYARPTSKRVALERGDKLSLEQLANIMIYGHPDVIEAVDEPDVITVIGGAHHVPKKTANVYQPPKQNFYEKRDKPVCIDCGRPRSAGGAGQCKECYRNKAMVKFQDRCIGIEYYLDAFLNLGVEIEKGEHWNMVTKVRSEPDFVPRLIDDISEIEEAYDLPAAQWLSRPELFEPRDRKPLFYANDAALRMAGPVREVKRVRVSPKSNAARRGKFLKAA